MILYRPLQTIYNYRDGGKLMFIRCKISLKVCSYRSIRVIHPHLILVRWSTEINESNGYILKYRIILWLAYSKYKSILGIEIGLRLLFNLIWLSIRNFVLTKDYMVRETFVLMARRIWSSLASYIKVRRYSDYIMWMVYVDSS